MAQTRYQVSIEIFVDGDTWPLDTCDDYGSGLHGRDAEREAVARRVTEQLESLGYRPSVQCEGRDVLLTEQEEVLLSRASEEEAAARAHYEQTRRELGIERAIWSMDYRLLQDLAPAFEGPLTVVYRDFADEQAVVCEAVTDPTWRDLFQVADRLIGRNGSRRRLCVEDFRLSGAELHLHTGF
ncbi:hypothetical protein [Thioalkalivibrio thiocyanodenitrificans]|uniref:hypothetical protein n=1 Tax=Thioalkalivibrio thiocyanodenitrificans TaxID=243063 RepID=UPI00036C864D|nr:hypothetical protein [Thioalkalivibrio thiocyanodenitrificans]